MQQLQVMNFLNEIAMSFPNAISLASGRPQSRFFDKQDWPSYEHRFTDYYAKEQGCSVAAAEKLLCQYAPSAGIINGILQRHLQRDEWIETDAQNIIVTNGCQEALALLCLHELQQPNDCMLTLDPSYIGFSGLLAAIGKRVEAVDVNRVYSTDETGQRAFEWSYLREKVAQIRQAGGVPKAIYINPDFNNPLAYCLSLADRLSLLQVCHELEIKIIEDNPYSRFNYAGQRIRSLKALDQQDIVYHIGSFSKTFCPGVRMGYLLVPEKMPSSLEGLVALKSLVSVNSSSLAQSVIGGFLLQNDYTLDARMTMVNAQYVRQRDATMAALTQYLSDLHGVSWDTPQGGFFVVVSLPFDFSESDVYQCADAHSVICMPVGFFSLTPELWRGKVRLAFSNFDPEVLTEGVLRFSRYVKQRLAATAAGQDK